MPMPAIVHLGRNLSLCFSIIKRPPLPLEDATASETTVSDDYDTTETVASATPDMATVYASRRFFFSSPGRSNSIIDSSSSVSEEGVAVEKYSDDPYGDFRKSMEEMVEARGLYVDGGESWKSLQELLLCYLSLNPKHTHRFIVAAFSDLLLSLLASRNFSLA